MTRPSGPPAAILFDFDHTLAHIGHFVDWDGAREAALPLYASAGIPAAFLAETPGIINLYGAVARARPLEPDRLRAVQAEVSRVIGRMEAAAIPRVAILPEAAACIRQLAAAGVTLGIVSSNAGDVVLSLLERDGLAALFAEVVGRDDVVELKPAAEGIARCCAQLRVEPGRTAYVGDMQTDVLAARAAGAFSVGVLTGLASRDQFVEARAHLILDGLAELPRRLGLE